MTILAKFEDGVFKPLEKVAIQEGTIVEGSFPSYEERLRNKSRPVGSLSFFGMWKDRTDIGDSTEYVDKLRRNLRG